MYPSTGYKTVLAALMLAAGFTATAATPVSIPTPEGTYIDLAMADKENAKVEGNAGPDQCFGSTGANTKVTFLLNNTVEQPYTFTMMTGHQGTCNLNLSMTDAAGQAVMTETLFVPDTKGWGRSTLHKVYINDPLPVGDYTLVITPSNLQGSGYAGNWGKFAFYAGIVDGRDHIPGPVSLGKGNYIGMRTENNDGNVGYVKDDTYGTYDIVCDEAGVYDLTWGVTKYGEGTTTFTVTDKEGNESVKTKWDVENLSNYAPVTIHLEGEIAKGENVLKILFNAPHTGFIANFNNISLAKVADHYSCVRNVAVEGQTVTEGKGYDFNCNLPITCNAETVSFSFDHPYGTVEVTAKKGEENVAVTEAGGKYTIPTPASNEETIVTMTLTPEAGSVVAYKTVYTMRVFHIGDIILNELTIDGTPVSDELFAAITAEPYKTTLAQVFTHMPVINAKFMHGQEITATPGELNGAKADYTFIAEVEGITRTYTLTIDGIHLYDRLDTDETIALKYNAGTYDEATKTWSDGQFSISGIDGGYNSEFKFPITAEGTYTIQPAVDAVVKQLIFKGLRDSYTKNTNIISAVNAGDATVWLPGDNRFYNTSEAGVRDLVVNIEGHQVGTPIEFTVNSNGQLMTEFEFTVGRGAVTTAPVVLSTSTVVPENANHFVAVAKFDRAIASAKATVNNTEIKAVGGSDVVYFPAWNLDYNTEYDLTITEAVDNYGNHLASPVTVKAATGAKAEAAKAEMEYVVSNVAEFKAALAAVNQSNKSADAPWVVIFVKNGDYDFGGEEQRFQCWNISIVGESREGVILHGNRSGISNPVISTRYSTNVYLQDLTIRNDYDWNKPRAGVGVALTSGNREVGVNLSLESQQDTQVTDGNQGYYLECDIYGSVDYICGGGNHFYDKCNFIMTADGTIAAPSTEEKHKWGYVLSNCTVTEIAENTVPEWFISRPWKNYPRTYLLNTKMFKHPAKTGYNSMGNLPTAFYEYGSMDLEGNLLDLSGRGNSPTHTGPAYNPVLTAEQAEMFTAENVLGQTDSYCVAEIAKRPEAPVLKTVEARAAGTTLTWDDNADARFYAIYRDGEYVGNTTANTFAADTNGDYTVRAANARGGMGAHSNVLTVGDSTAIGTVEADETVDVEYYNLQGIRISGEPAGACIKVAVKADGTRDAKVVVK